ncbi:porin [Bradyrhizobium sp. STM 3809]|uniref:porin n=1 Tax=Bradyrhizobium sp. STM 3809 TaxID=551936 RepID=UPI00055599C5|nr:porin [Bradyrhizobium sp. STM 3809]
MSRSFILGIIASRAIAAPASAGSPGSSLLAPNSAAASEASTTSKPPATRRPASRPGAANPCASFGANFVRVEGTDTCVKVGGALRFETGASVGR